MVCEFMCSGMQQCAVGCVALDTERIVPQFFEE